MRKPPVSFRIALRRALRRSPARRPLRPAGALARDERGATAVEFALLLVPFMLLFFGLFELGMVYFATSTLENAVIDSSRAIRTGQVQTAGQTAAAFKTATCDRMNWMEGACEDALRIDVRTVATFASTEDLDTPTSPCWDPGGPASLVLVRAYYSWPLVTPLLQAVLETADGKRTLTMTTAFVNEPYDNSTATAVECPA